MKKYILTILITAIVCITGTVIASNYLASEVVYNDTTVESALNELYTVHETYKNLTTETDFGASDLLNGKKAYNSNGELITGTSDANCKSGVVTISSAINTSNGQELFDFIPSSFILQTNANSNYESEIFYIPEAYGNDIIEVNLSNSNRSVINDYFRKFDGKFYAKNWSLTSGKIYYYACK